MTTSCFSNALEQFGTSCWLSVLRARLRRSVPSTPPTTPPMARYRTACHLMRTSRASAHHANLLFPLQTRQAHSDVTAEVPARANLVPDAHLAAVLSQNGVVTLYTHDRDFRKFSFLNVVDPLA